MTTSVRSRFRTAVVLDTEFNGHDRGGVQHVVALVAHLLRDGRPAGVLRFFEDDLRRLRSNPLPTGPDAVWVAFAAQAEWHSLLSLGWRLPENSIDLYAECRNLRNLALPSWLRRRLDRRGDGLVDNCEEFGVRSMNPEAKHEARDLILRGGPWTGDERGRILDYCGEDVTMTAGLWAAIDHRLSPGHALLRGWFTQAIGDMEYRGIPIDREALDTIVGNLAGLRGTLVREFDPFGLYDPDREAIAPDRLVALMDGRRIAWPTTRTGRPQMRLGTLRRRLRDYPDLHAVVALAQGLNDLRGLRALPVGPDGRARASLRPFASATGRNIPREGFLFSLSRWVRSLIRPSPGRFVCYSDWTAQEFAIIAYLSRDPLLIRCYESPGDPYVNLGAVMRLIPAGAPKGHPLRDVIKVVVLGLFYGRGARSIAKSTGRRVTFIRDVIRDFWARCPKARRWLLSYIDGMALLDGVHTKFGWTAHRHPLTKSTTAANFPVQANAAEMMRWAACLAYENGVPLCAPVHDAFLAEGRVEDEREVVAMLAACMGQASRNVLGGATVRAQTEIFRHPDRFVDKDGRRTWEWIAGSLDPRLVIRPPKTA